MLEAAVESLKAVQLMEYKCVPAEFEQSLLRCEVLAHCCAELRADGIPTQRSLGTTTQFRWTTVLTASS